MSFHVTGSTKKDPRASPLWGLLHLYCKLIWWPTSEIIAKHRCKLNLASMAGFNKGVTKFELGQQPKLANQTNIQIKTKERSYFLSWSSDLLQSEKEYHRLQPSLSRIAFFVMRPLFTSSA